MRWDSVKIPIISSSMYRLLARLYLDIDPRKALQYAEQASENGDTLGASVHSDVLDYVSGTLPSTSYLSHNRLQLISQLIAKLDPSFAYQVLGSGDLGKSGFITFISGTRFCLIKTDQAFCFVLDSWKKFSNNSLRDILSSEKLTCIICLSQTGVATSCPGCGIKLCSFSCLGEYQDYHQLSCAKPAPCINFYTKKY